MSASFCKQQKWVTSVITQSSYTISIVTDDVHQPRYPTKKLSAILMTHIVIAVFQVTTWVTFLKIENNIAELVSLWLRTMRLNVARLSLGLVLQTCPALLAELRKKLRDCSVLVLQLMGEWLRWRENDSDGIYHKRLETETFGKVLGALSIEPETHLNQNHILGMTKQVANMTVKVQQQLSTNGTTDHPGQSTGHFQPWHLQLGYHTL